MPSKRRTENRSKAFNQRMVKFSFDEWSKGLVTDFAENPTGSLQELINARDRGSEIAGRVGSRLFNKATKKMTVYIDQTLVENAASNNIVHDDIFFILDINDTTDHSMTKAKELVENVKYEFSDEFEERQRSWFYDLRPYDMFRYISEGDIPEPYVEFLGNVEIPCFKDLRSFTCLTRASSVVDQKLVADFKATVSSGIFTITSSQSSFMTSTFVVPKTAIGLYVTVYTTLDKYPIRDIITERFSDLSFRVASDKIPDGSYEFIYISSSIYSSLFSRENNKLIVHCGEDVYYADLPFYGWKKLRNLTDTKPFPDRSRIDIVEKDLLLYTKSGIFRIDIEANYYWQVNAPNPEVKVVNPTKKIFGFADTELYDDDDNPVEMAGFSGVLENGYPDGTGGVIV